MWRLWRAGYKLVSAIHDQVVIESVADDHVLERKAEVERLMIEGMLAVVPGMNVRVETVVSLSLNKDEWTRDTARSGDANRRLPNKTGGVGPFACPPPVALHTQSHTATPSSPRPLRLVPLSCSNGVP